MNKFGYYFAQLRFAPIHFVLEPPRSFASSVAKELVPNLIFDSGLKHFGHPSTFVSGFPHRLKLLG